MGRFRKKSQIFEIIDFRKRGKSFRNHRFWKKEVIDFRNYRFKSTIKNHVEFNKYADEG